MTQGKVKDTAGTMIQTYELDAEIQKDLSPTKDINDKETEKPGGI